ncbi:choline dehydrogenase [Phyllosticta capitalensis]|uniref:Choline dehydrogenase n=2 Tax=Phyllosticta capitalensis TaxID=121624 RepID=A0ABR1Z5N3_9PEZI
MSAYTSASWSPLLLLLLCTALSYATASPPTSTTFNHTFDFVIVGGGTAGLVLANRLSANASVRVAVIEAGGSVQGDPRVLNTTSFGLGLGTELDWAYATLPQRFARNETQTCHAGRALGGTSTINGMTYLRAQRAEIDAWETMLNNSGWNWSTVYRCYNESEHFQPPSPSQAANGAAFDAAFHGTDGPVRVGWQETAPLPQSGTAVVEETWANLGVQRRADPAGGAMRGFSTWPLTVDARTSTRADAATAYLWPVVGERENLMVLLNTTATRVLWREGEHDEALASGVEVITADGRVEIVRARREVILAAGALRTPALLEHSGVGDPAILNPLSIPLKVALPSVGANLIDQTNVPLSASLLLNSSSSPDFHGYPTYVTYLTLRDLIPNATAVASLRASAMASIQHYASLNVAANPPTSGPTLAAQTTLLRAQLDLMFSNAATLPVVEILTAPFAAEGSGVVTMPSWALRPLGRGSVHITATSDYDGHHHRNASIAINPNYLLQPLDRHVQRLAVRAATQYLHTAPLSAFVNTSSLPLPLPLNDTILDKYIAQSYGPNAHFAGTTAMLPREVGGVVDARLKVYGTSNVRVVDASVLPWQVSGHLSATVYAVAERAAEMILQGEMA